MSSWDLLIEPEAAVRSNEVMQDILTIGSDRKVNDVSREPGFQALHPSPSTADRKEATKPKKAHGRKSRNPKKGKVGSGRGTPRTTDQRAGNKAIATTDTSSKKTDAAPVGSAFHSSSKSKRLDAEKSPAVSSMQESVDQEASASQVVAPSDSKNETGEAQESKKLPVISDEAAHSSSISSAFAQSCFPEAVVLKRKEGNKNADAGTVSGRGSPASTSKTTRPTQPLVCDPSPAPYYAAESSRNKPEVVQVAATAEKRGGPGNGGAVVIQRASTGSSGQLSPSPRVSSPSPIAVRAGKLPADAPVLVPPEPLADTSESENSAPWHGRIMKIIKHDSVSTDPEKKHRPVPPNVKSRYSGTADYQVTLARLRLGLFADDPDEATRSSQLHRAWVLLPLAVLIVALAVVLAARKHRGAYMASTFYLQNESGVCTTEACRRVVAFAARNTDAEFNPCMDFHRHACGRWFAGRTARRSYADENWLNFTAAAHLALSQLPLTLEPGQQDSPHALHEIQMARFYASCLSYARKRPSTRTADVLERTGLNESSWAGFSSPQQLFDYVVAASFDTGLAGMFRAGKSAGGRSLVVDIGESLHSTLGDETASFLSVTLRQLGWRNNASLVAAVESLDAGMEEARKGSKVNFSPLSSAFTVGEVRYAQFSGIFMLRSKKL